MSNIREIEVNGEVFGIESANDIYVGKQEPTSEVKPNIWIQPSNVRMPREYFGMERKPGSTSSEGDYTLDENGNIVETTDTSTSGTRTTKMFGVFTGKQYKLAFRDNFSNSNTLTWGVYFYNINKEFISKTLFVNESGTSYPKGDTIISANPPEGTRFMRLLIPYNNSWSSVWCDGDATVDDISDSMYSSSTDKFYEYDGDHYVQI